MTRILSHQSVVYKRLEKMGFTVMLVGNRNAAVTAWAAHCFDLIRVDCQMPEFDGRQAAREIRQRENNGSRKTIITLSAHAIEAAELASKGPWTIISSNPSIEFVCASPGQLLPSVV